MAKLQVSTIIVSYNTAELTTKSIQTVLDAYKKEKISGEIIVVDNDSTDDSLKKIIKKYARKITLIKNAQNLGFAKANNQGIKRAKGQYILLLNSDAFLLQNALSNLLTTFQDHKDDPQTAQLEATNLIDRLGIVSGQLLNADGTIQPQGGSLPNLWTIFWWAVTPLPAHFLPNSWSYHIEDVEFFKDQQQIGWIGGTAMLIRKQVIEQIGDLDEEIFMYAEDVEFCLRARKHHWDIVINPAAKIVHLGSASSSNHHARTGEARGLLHIGAKHFPAWQFALIRLMLALGASLRILLFGIISGNVEKTRVAKEILSDLRSYRQG